jgi:hypothetical protein
MPCPFLNSANLAFGIEAFLAKTHWRSDFHNRFYANVTGALHQSAGLAGSSVGGYVTRRGVLLWQCRLNAGGVLWGDMLHELTYWKALRPFKRSHFAAMPLALKSAFSALPPGVAGRRFPPALPIPHSLRTLFDTAQVLKPAKGISAVFPSKCCHMLVPWEFPIWDNQFVGNTSKSRRVMLESLEDWIELPSSVRKSIGSRLTKPDYWCYREVLLQAWDTAPAPLKSQLQAQLNQAILNSGIGHPVWGHYPYRTKIPELCLA